MVDLRGGDEKFGGVVEAGAKKAGLDYVAIPISREAISADDLTDVCRTVFEPGSEPLYVFSRFSRKKACRLRTVS